MKLPFLFAWMDRWNSSKNDKNDRVKDLDLAIDFLRKKYIHPTEERYQVINHAIENCEDDSRTQPLPSDWAEIIHMRSCAHMLMIDAYMEKRQLINEIQPFQFFLRSPMVQSLSSESSHWMDSVQRLVEYASSILICISVGIFIILIALIIISSSKSFFV